MGGLGLIGAVLITHLDFSGLGMRRQLGEDALGDDESLVVLAMSYQGQIGFLPINGDGDLAAIGGPRQRSHSVAVVESLGSGLVTDDLGELRRRCLDSDLCGLATGLNRAGDRRHSGDLTDTVGPLDVANGGVVERALGSHSSVNGEMPVHHVANGGPTGGGTRRNGGDEGDADKQSRRRCGSAAWVALGVLDSQLPGNPARTSDTDGSA